MFRVLALVTSLFCLNSWSAFAQSDATALVAICDHAAASPLDSSRPAGVAGVDFDKVDPKIAIPSCEAAVLAAPSDGRIAYQLGRTYHVAKLYEKARRQYEIADGLGSLLATYNLANLHESGEGPVDHAKATQLLEKAAQQGLVLSMYMLAQRHYDGTAVPKDLVAARAWHQKVANLGYTHSMARLAYLLAEGQGGPKDTTSALKWYKTAANAGNAYSMNALGTMYYHGLDVRKDYASARHWHQKAAESGVRDAMFFMGLMLQKGLGGPKNYAGARRWYQKAAELGDAAAMNQLGVMDQAGEGGPRNYESARQWYHKSALADPTDQVALDNLNNITRYLARGRQQSGGSARHYNGGNEGYRPRRTDGLGATGAPCFNPSTPGC